VSRSKPHGVAAVRLEGAAVFVAIGREKPLRNTDDQGGADSAAQGVAPLLPSV